jgi:acyl-CoA reductase-like NAD-dependent aldehyde dehydrogenase
VHPLRFSNAIVHSSVADKFVQLAVKRANEIKASATPEGLRGLFNEASAKRVDGLLVDAIAKGARVVGGKHEVVGNLVQPVIVEGVSEDANLFREEAFGPVLSVIRFDDVEEAIRIANSSEYGLAAAVYTVCRVSPLSRVRLHLGLTWPDGL